MNSRAWYRTNSGALLDLARPEDADIRLADLAHHLARLCRFNGAVDSYYSVASHSTYVAVHLEAEYGVDGGRAGLLHDAAEAYLGDMTTGLKRLFPEYRALQNRWQAEIEARFGVAGFPAAAVKNADLRARLSEARDCFANYPREELLGGEGGLDPYPAQCYPASPEEAEAYFLQTAVRLGLA